VYHENVNCIFDRVKERDEAFDTAWTVVADWDDELDGEALRVEVERHRIRMGSKK
jgi:hypothetical protein